MPIDSHLIPDAARAVNLGAAGGWWNIIYARTLMLSGTDIGPLVLNLDTLAGAQASLNAGYTNSIEVVIANANATSVNYEKYSVYRALSAGGTAIGTDKTKVKAANTLTYMVAGQIYTLATADHWTLTGAAFGGAAITARGYLLLLNAAGTATVSATANATGGSEAAAIAALVWPALPASSAVVGYVTVATDGVTAFTPGTSELDAAAYTEAYANGAPPALIAAF